MSIKFLPDIEDLVEGLGITGIAALLLLPVFAPVITRVGKLRSCTWKNECQNHDYVLEESFVTS